jgi:hypothetical protein
MQQQKHYNNTNQSKGNPKAFVAKQLGSSEKVGIPPKKLGFSKTVGNSNNGWEQYNVYLC